MISIDDFKKVEIKVGQILSAEKIENADKLLKLKVDFGFKREESAAAPAAGAAGPAAVPAPAPDIRQVVSGIALQFPDPAVLVGKKCAFVTNLEPRTIRGLESQAMILAAGGGDEPFSLFYPDQAARAGSAAR